MSTHAKPLTARAARIIERAEALTRAQSTENLILAYAKANGPTDEMARVRGWIHAELVARDVADLLFHTGDCTCANCEEDRILEAEYDSQSH